MLRKEGIIPELGVISGPPFRHMIGATGTFGPTGAEPRFNAAAADSTPEERAVPALGDLRDRYPSDISQMTVLRLFGIRTAGQRNTWSPKRCVPFIVVNVSPLLLAAVEQMLHPAKTSRMVPYFGWLAYYCAVNFVVVLCQWSGCRLFNAIAQSIDEMLTIRGRAELHAWLDRGNPQRRQLRYMLLGSVIAVVTLFELSTIHRLTDHLYIGLASYMSVALTGAAGANCLYWILRAARLSRLITRRGHIRLWWMSPANTPGIECLSRWYRIVTAWAALGGTIAFAPAVYISRYVPGDRVFAIIKWGLAITLMLSVALFGLYSHWRLSATVTEKRIASLRRLKRALPQQPPIGSGQVDEESMRLFDLFSRVSGSPTGVVNNQTIASMTLTLLTGAIPLIITLLIR
ncbi:hypothetical protein ABZS86_28940 [Streptomyces sp. NPDC005355]|uniref:hypothetical protein n=1 Tax=Streptomyces sp. NPDC005355 TaxID=3157038 RepID=UPI0033A356A0